MANLKINHFYKFNDRGEVHVGQYTGTENGFECCVCNKGCKAHTFNIWYNQNEYESWGFGNNHLPKIIEDLGEELVTDK